MDAKEKAELRRLATAYLRGESPPLETARALSAYEDEAPDDLREPLTAMVGVVSETDDIPLGAQRSFWHPEVRAKEDRKHDEAQARAAPLVRRACERLIMAL